MFILFLSSTYISCTETSKPQEPAPPEFSSPDMIQPRSPLSGDIVRCIPLAFDPNQDPLSYTYQWTDQEGNIVSESLEFQLGEDFEPLDTIACTVVAHNDLGEEAVQTDSVSVYNTNPEISDLIITPYADITVLSELECSAQGEDPDGFLVETSYKWTIDEQEVGEGATLQLSADIAYDGARVSCTASVLDPHGGSVQEQVDVVLGNSIPQIESISLSEETVYGYTPVSCLVAATDGDGDDVSIRYKWVLDGIIQQQHDADFDLSLLPNGRFPAGGELSCTATPYDDIGNGAPMTISTTILNEAPTISTLQITPEAPYADSHALCSVTAADPDLLPVSVSYKWQRDGELDGAALSEESSISLSPELIAPGTTLSCIVTVTDAFGEQAEEETSVLIQDSNPVIVSLDISTSTSAEPTVGSVLSCLGTATDINNDMLTYAYSWTDEQGTVLGQGSTLTLTNENSHPFEPIYCTVVVTPSTSVVSSTESVVVGNIPPTITSVVLTPASPTVDSTFTCTIEGVADQEEQALVEEFRWYLNGVVQSETGANFAPSALSVADNVRCSARVTDGFASSDWMEDHVAVENQDPDINSVSITPTGAILASDVLTCSYVAVDPDGGVLQATYAWTQNTQDTGITSSILQLNPITNSPDDIFACTVTVTDTNEGTATSSAQIVVANSTPYFSQPAALTSGTTSAYMGDVLTCSATALDLDGPTTITYSWEAPNGNVLGQGESFEVSQSNVGSWEDISCVARAVDGQGSAFSSSVDIQILNSLPILSSVALSPAMPISTDDLTCIAGPVTDADMETVELSYSWYIDGILQNESTDELAGPFSVGSTVSCKVTPIDAVASGDSVESVVTIQNSPPVISDVTIAPAIVYVDSSVTCVSTVTDLDNETLIVSLEWTDAAGNLLSTDSQLQLSRSIIGTEKLTCTVTARDESGATVKESSFVQLENTHPEWNATASISKPNGVLSNQTITCSAESNDLEDGSLSVQYSWTNDAEEVLGTQDALLLDPALTSVGDALTCTATATDSGGVSISSTASETLINSPPTVVVEIPESVYKAGNAIPCAATGADEDGHAVTFAYAWDIDGTVQTATSSSFQGSFTRGNVVTCTVTPNDGISDGAAIAATVTIANTAPTLTSIDFDNSTLYTNDTAQVTAVISDLDGDPVTVTYSWYVDATLVQSGSSSTLDGAVYFDKDQEVYVEVDVTDGYEEAGTTGQTDPITINNTAPTAPVVSISPSQPSILQQDIICEIVIDAVDVDGDVLSYQYSWKQNGDTFLPTLTNAQAQTVVAEEVAIPGTWECDVTVTDEDGASVTSNTASTNIEKQGESIDSAAPSCQSIQDSGYFGDSTSYWLNPDGGTPFATMCDFATDGGGWMLAFSSPASDTTMGSSWDYWYTAGSTADLDTDVTGKSEVFDRVQATEIRLTATEGTSEIRADLDSTGVTLLSLTGSKPVSCLDLQGSGQHQFSSTYRTGTYFTSDTLAIVVCDTDGPSLEVGTHYDLAVFSTNLSHGDYNNSIGDIGSEDRVGGAQSTTSASSGNILRIWVR